MGIVTPANVEDLHTIVRHAAAHRIPLIPRGAGTSLAGQVVGDGLVVDLRKFDRILDFDPKAQTYTIMPDIEYRLRDGTTGTIDLSPIVPNSSTVDRDITLGDVVDRLAPVGIQVEFLAARAVDGQLGVERDVGRAEATDDRERLRPRLAERLLDGVGQDDGRPGCGSVENRPPARAGSSA